MSPPAVLDPSPPSCFSPSPLALTWVLSSSNLPTPSPTTHIMAVRSRSHVAAAHIIISLSLIPSNDGGDPTSMGEVVDMQCAYQGVAFLAIFSPFSHHGCQSSSWL
jgi:hypothetical protein